MAPSTDVLITGAHGLLGSSLRRLLPGATAIGRGDGDLRDRAAVQAIFDRLRPRRVIHLAAEVGGVKRNATCNPELLADNALINTNVLEAAHRFGVQSLISVLSSCAYRFYDDRASHEGDLHEGLPFDGNLGYGYAKRLLEIQTRLLRRSGRAYGTITPVTMYGADDDWDLEAGHVVAALIHKSFLARARGGAFEVWGSGKAIRQFIYAPDVARVLIEAIEDPPESLIVAADRGISIGDLARAVAAATDFQGEIVFDSSKPEGAAVRVLESRDFIRRFPRFAFTPLAQGLWETARAFAAKQAVSIP